MGGSGLYHYWIFLDGALGFFKKKDVDHSMSEMAPKSQLLENVLKYAAFICYAWLAVGLIVKFFV